MSLADLIKKGSLRGFATATPATPATDRPPIPLSVATVATVAVATPRSTENAIHPVSSHTPEELEVLGWLDSIGENDPVVIGETIQKCRDRPDWCDAFVRAARGDYSGVH